MDWQNEQPFRGRTALVIIPGRVSYFYDTEGQRVAEAFRNLGGTAHVHTLFDYPQQSFDWCFLLNLSEIVHAYNGDVPGVMKQLEMIKQRCGRVALVLLESVKTQWFMESFNLMRQAGVEILLDLGFHDQREQTPHKARPYYHFVFNGLVASEQQVVPERQTGMASRPLPWTFVGHLTPVRFHLLKQLTQKYDRQGFVYLVHFTPVTETGPHLNQHQFHQVLQKTRFKIWCSHHHHPYVESIRFRLALLAGALPVKIELFPQDFTAQVPFPYLILPEEGFVEQLRTMNFETVRGRFVDEFCQLPRLEKTLSAALINLENGGDRVMNG